MAERISALKGHYETGRFGEEGDPGVTFIEAPAPVLYQVAAWPDTLETVAARVADMAGAGAAPSPGKAVAGRNGALLRVEPFKWWLYGIRARDLDPEQGTTLDLSHSRVQLRVAGPQARECLNRLVPLDLREQSFPAGSVASSAMFHVGVTLWRSEEGYELFLPRGFAVSVWEVLFDTAVQFGAEVG